MSAAAGAVVVEPWSPSCQNDTYSDPGFFVHCAWQDFAHWLICVFSDPFRMLAISGFQENTANVACVSTCTPPLFHKVGMTPLVPYDRYPNACPGRKHAS